MKVGMIGLVIAVGLALVFSLPALASQNSTITITMTGLNEISISLDKTEWPLGTIASNTVYETVPAIEWCTLTIAGTCNVKTLIVGDDAQWIGHPGAYQWTLSDDGTNGEHIYGLWFRVSGDTTRGYVPITKTQGELWPYAEEPSLTPGDKKQFGLRLLSPTYFYSSRQMQTQIIIGAVVA
jgi:hypothetical protein